MKVKVSSDSQNILVTEATTRELRQVKNCLTREAKNARFDIRYKRGLWDGKFSYFNKNTLPIGLGQHCQTCMEKYGYTWRWENPELIPRTEITTSDFKEFLDYFFEHHRTDTGDKFYPRDYQIEAAYNSLVTRYASLEIATSGGKTFASSLMIFYYLYAINPEGKVLINVPTIDLVRQFYNDINSYNYGFQDENPNPLPIICEEMMSDKPRKVRPGEGQPNVYISVGKTLINTIKDQPDFFDRIDFAIIDEGHSRIKETKKVMERLRHANYRVSMTGTLPPADSLEWLSIQSYSGPRAIQVKLKKLIDRGYATPVEVKSIEFNHHDDYMAYTISRMLAVGMGSDAYRLETRYCQRSIDRTKKIVAAASKIKQNSLFLFQFVEYGEYLLQVLQHENPHQEYYLVHGKINKRSDIFKTMEDTTGKTKILIASYGTASTGISIKAITNLFLLESYKSDSKVRQSIGRMLRKHKEKDKAWVYDLSDTFDAKRENILKRHAKARIDIYKQQQIPYTNKKVDLEPIFEDSQDYLQELRDELREEDSEFKLNLDYYLERK